MNECGSRIGRGCIWPQFTFPSPCPAPRQTIPLLGVLSRYLAMYGYYRGGVDGHFGAETEAAVARLQRLLGLPVDGVVGGNLKVRGNR